MFEARFGSSFTGSGAGETGGNKVKLTWGGVVVPDVGVDRDMGPVVLEDGVTVGVNFNKLGCFHFSPTSLTSKGKSATS